MAKWLEAAGVETCDLAGHSFGGGVAQAMLLECPERIRRLALIASGGLGREVGWLLRLASLPRVGERFGQPFMGTGGGRCGGPSGRRDDPSPAQFQPAPVSRRRAAGGAAGDTPSTHAAGPDRGVERPSPERRWSDRGPPVCVAQKRAGGGTSRAQAGA